MGMDSTSDVRQLLADLAACSGHSLRAGASADVLAVVERDLGTRLPQAYRELLGRSDGVSLCDGLVVLWSTGVLVEKNRGLHSPGGWFDESHIFVAQSASDERFRGANRGHLWGPDYFYIDTKDGDDPPIRAFHLTPTKLGLVGSSLHEWIELVVRNEGFGAPGDFDWS